MTNRRAVLVAATVVAEFAMLGFVACGGQFVTAEGPEAGPNHDGASSDRESEHTTDGDASPASDVAAPSDGGSGDSAPPDAFFPYPADAEVVDGCYPYVCHVGELCVTIDLASSEVVHAWCVDMPLGCGHMDPPATCECLERSSVPWCPHFDGYPTCAVDAGRIVLTCITVPPP